MNGLASTGPWLGSGGWQTVSMVVLAALLVAAAFVDVREHRIPNAIVLAGLAAALLFAHLPGGTLSGSLIGVAVGMGLGLPLYWLRAMGAGDVKLMGMVGAFLGGADMFAAALVIFVVGGLMGLAAVARRRAYAQLGTNLRQMTLGSLVNTMSGAGPALEAPGRSVGVLPYGVAIAAGTLLYLALLKGGIVP